MKKSNKTSKIIAIRKKASLNKSLQSLNSRRGRGSTDKGSRPSTINR